MKIKRILHKVIIVLIILTALLSGIYLAVDKNLRSIINDYCASKAAVAANEIINREICLYLEKNNVSFSGIVRPVYDGDFNVKSIETDSMSANLIKSGVVKAIQDKIAESKEVNISVPLGTIIGSELTVNRGPKFNASMQMSSVVSTELISEFKEAGINQTLHRLLLEVSVNIYLVQPWYRSSESIDCDFILAETVIVGNVPEAYTVVIQGDDEDTAGNVSDYGAQNYID